jgi:WD40 repeat protein
MKFKKRSTQKRRQHLLKRGLINSILQHGGGFMDMMTSLNAMEGHSYSSMSVHSTKPLIVTGNNTRELILWKINTESPPKKLAVLIGLPSAVKFTEFHKTLPIIAAGCSDKVLMWRYQEEEGQEDVQQLQPSHTVFSLKSEAELEREFSEMKTNLKQMEQIIDKLYDEKETLKGNDMPIYIRRKEIDAEITSKNRDIKKIPNALKTLEIEINNLKRNLQNEVSCITFHPNQPYIAVGLNNETTNVSSRFVMYTFDLDPDPSVKALYDIIPDNYSPRNEVNVLMASFSSDGNMFAYTTCRRSNGSRGVLRVQNFYTDNQELETSEKKVYEIPNRSVTCITPYKSNREYHDGSIYSSRGIMMTHEFLIGCDDGSLRLIDVITVQPSWKGATIRIEKFISVKEWNGGRDKITCLAIHPSLPLFASGSGDAAKLWEFESNKELETLPLHASPLSCVGFNDNFLAVCGSGNIHFYGCNPDDYRGYAQKKLERKEKAYKLHTELRVKTLKGSCPICLRPMSDSSTQWSISSGPEKETYLPSCVHKFHEHCIKEWLGSGGTTCPECRGSILGGLTQETPKKVIETRKQNLEKEWKRFDAYVEEEKAKRALKFSHYPTSQRTPSIAQRSPSIAQGSPLRYIQGKYSEQQPSPQSSERPLTLEELRAARLADIARRKEQSSENGGGGIKNKYSRKKYNSKKSKICRHYSKKK